MSTWRGIGSAPLDGTPVITRFQGGFVKGNYYGKHRLQSENDDTISWVNSGPSQQPDEWAPMPREAAGIPQQLRAIAEELAEIEDPVAFTIAEVLRGRALILQWDNNNDTSR